jgi:hypothetical protein
MSADSSIPSFNAVTTLQDLQLKALVVVPSFALAYVTTWYFVGRLGGGREVIRGQPGGSDEESRAGSRSPGGPQYLTVDRRRLVLALQILVGSLVTFGGTAYVVFAVNPLGTAFGSGHLVTGLVGLTVGIVTLRRKVLPRNALLGINVFTIAYSAASDAAAGALSLLPSSAFHDSVIGTLVAIIMSSLIVYLVTKR